MTGISAQTGQTIGDDAHLAQSIADILSTPLGSRVMRRDYGSLLFELIDRPLNAALRMLLNAATAIALRRWEPRLNLTRVRLSGEPAAGQLTVHIEGRRTDLPAANDLVTFSIPINPQITTQSRTQGATAQPAS